MLFPVSDERDHVRPIEAERRRARRRRLLFAAVVMAAAAFAWLAATAPDDDAGMWKSSAPFTQRPAR